MAAGTPKIAQRLLVRTFLLLVTLAALLGVYQYLRSRKDDFDFAVVDTTGWIAAYREEKNGQRAVAISPEGKIVEVPGWKDGDTDRDLAWGPDGNRVFFISDRDGPGAKPGQKAFNIFRWNPVNNPEPDQRTVGSRGRSALAFDDQPPAPGAEPTALITSSGFVLEFDSKERATRQVLPPIANEVAQSNEDGGSATSQFSAFYGELGNSFRVARYLRNRDFIAAVMRRDEGEVLVVQDMRLAGGKFKRPFIPAAGERIDIAVSPKDGSLVAAIQEFRWPDVRAVPPQYRRGNQILTPFRHAVLKIDPEKGLEPPVVASESANAFGSPAISPDGSQLVLLGGVFADGSLDPSVMLVLPNQPAAGGAAARLVEGKVFGPAWRPDGSGLVYAKRDADGSRALFAIGKDGSGERRLTPSGANFGGAVVSPKR